MESFVRHFIRSSLVWFGIGIIIGLTMTWWPAQHLVYRPAHGHAHLLGFVSMMIFGVAYHVIPRFAGNPLRSRRMAFIHLWLANLGLAGMVGGWILRGWVGFGTPLLAAGGALTAIGAFLFIYNIWVTLGPAKRTDLVGIGPQPGVPPGVTRPEGPLRHPGQAPHGGPG